MVNEFRDEPCEVLPLALVAVVLSPSVTSAVQDAAPAHGWDVILAQPEADGSTLAAEYWRHRTEDAAAVRRCGSAAELI